MSQRFDITTVLPAGYKAMLGLHGGWEGLGLDPALVELVKVRVSQMNGCAFCIGMHVDVALKHGVSHDRLHFLPVWREALVYSGVERAALAWAEAVNRLEGGDVPDAAYEGVRAFFSPEQVAALTLAVVEIGGWNRLMIASRTPPAPREG